MSEAALSIGAQSVEAPPADELSAGPLSVGAGSTRSGPAQSTEICATQLIRRVLQASQDLDPLALQAELDLAATVFGLAGCVDDIVIPATAQLHSLLAAGERDVAQDVMATEAVRTWLNQRGSFAPAPLEIEPVLLACGPRDVNVIGLECLALLLRFQRWPCRMLGARVSTFTLTIAARAADATGVVVVSTENRALPHAIVSLHAVDALGIPVFYAGSAFEPETSRRQLPGHYLGSSLERACTLLIDTLAPTGQRRSTAIRRQGPGTV